MSSNKWNSNDKVPDRTSSPNVYVHVLPPHCMSILTAQKHTRLLVNLLPRSTGSLNLGVLALVKGLDLAQVGLGSGGNVVGEARVEHSVKKKEN